MTFSLTVSNIFLLQVQQDFEELPPEAHGSLRDSLVLLLIKFSANPVTVRTQLCLALAAFAAHVPQSHWGPGGVVQWFAGRLGGEPQQVAVPCMLELLTVVPQVWSSETAGRGRWAARVLPTKRARRPTTMFIKC